MELTITGINEITYPQLHVWDWTVAIYLFLGGVTAGLLIMSAIANLRIWPDGDSKAHCTQSAMYAPLILAIGMIFIFFDLDHKSNVFWFYLTFQPFSPMSWGSWCIATTIPVSFLYGLSTLPGDLKHLLVFDFLKKLSDNLNPHMRKLAIVSFILGIYLGIYTGILLSAMLARPLWNSSLLPVLFLNSAISTGTAFLIVVSRRLEVKLFFTKVDIWLIIAEIMIIVIFFYGQYTSSAAHKASIMPFFTFTHGYFLYFLAILLVSILLPLALVLELLEMKEEHLGTISRSNIFKMNLSATMVLVGGFVIRLALIYAGQISKLT